MSRVFVAEETRLRRKVVVKVLSPELAQGISVERFEREIQTVAALQQANIVGVLSAGDTNGLPFYTMPYVEGESLRSRLARGPLAVTEVIAVLRDVTRALAYAHQRGVVHRDIKPDNVLMSGGAAVVTDFGIAKAISAARTASGSATLTQIGTSIGTPAYMAPEQAAGDPHVDHRADIYSLGAMAYELLTGHVVFADRTPQRMVAAHMSEAPMPITAFRPDLPAALGALVMQCLAKEANDRPQSAGEIALALDSMTSGSGMQATPPVLLGGPGMLRKALAIYAASFVAVAIMAKAAIVGIGLPDWVFPGALIVMALGLPVVLWTGYVQRVTRRAMTLTPTYTPGGTPSMAHGTMATLALKAAPKMSWYRTARGGMYALVVFILMIAAFMAMRAFGIGPAGSLLASGKLKAKDPILLTDFKVSGADPSLGRVVSDAVRAGLAESSVITLEQPTAINAALERMQRPDSSRIDYALARQLAVREGIKAIVDGEVTTLGSGYVLVIRLAAAESGNELWSARATADNPRELIDAIDKLTRRLRDKVGESLRNVQGGAPLAQVTTGSLEALRKYSEGKRAYAARDFPRSVRLLREAVAIDTTFAEGWRALGRALGNTGGPASERDSALTRAYRSRDRLSERERDLATIEYFASGPGRDRAKAVAGWEAMLARGDSSQIAELSGALLSRRELARAESLARISVRMEPDNVPGYGNLMSFLRSEGKLASAESVLAAVSARFPNNRRPRLYAMWMMYSKGELGPYEHALDSARKVRDPADPTTTLQMWAGYSMLRGHVSESRAANAEVVAAFSSIGASVDPARVAALGVWTSAMATGAADIDLRALDAAIDRGSTPSLLVARAYAVAGRVERAKAVLARYVAEVRDTAVLRASEPEMHTTRGEVALGERKWRDAVDEFRRGDRAPDGPADDCSVCLPLGLSRAFDVGGQADSAIVQYELFVRTPLYRHWAEQLDGAFLARAFERLGQLYEEKGDATNAAENDRKFIELWKNADPELQPRVAAARARLKRLGEAEAPAKKPR
jgi:eukaryotic-like serine/threonine-protein kinase